MKQSHDIKAKTEPGKTLRIYFDLSRQEKWHRCEWEKLLCKTNQNPSEDTCLVESPDNADCIIDTLSDWHFGSGGRVFGSHLSESNGVPRFVWDAGDHPVGRQSGFFCSLPRQLFDCGRHRSFCYPIRYNECVSPFGLTEARVLYGFVGGVTSGLRARMLSSLRRVGRSDEMQLIVQNGPWNQMLDRSGVPLKQSYAEALRRSRFFLCPRGNGVGSVRLFETMQAARVPVIIADDYVLPHHVDWEDCAVLVREREVEKIPEILRSRADEWPQLAENALRVWERNFSESALLSSFGNNLRELMTEDVEKFGNRVRIAKYWLKRNTRIWLGKVWKALHRKRQ